MYYQLLAINIRTFATTTNPSISKIQNKIKMYNNKVLCVAEKHDAAKNIAKFLSNGSAKTRKGKGKFIYNFDFNRNFENRNANFTFASVRGHVMNYDFDPKYRIWIQHQIVDLFQGKIEQKTYPAMKDIVENLRNEASKASVLIIWTDCDREGEHIGNEVVQICRKANPRLFVYRAKFSEITQSAVERAMQRLCALDEKIVKAVDCRMELDLRIGAAFTRLQTLYIRKENLCAHFGNDGIQIKENNNVISYGSCQFPTLGFVVERYKDRVEFISEPFWKLTGKDGKNRVIFNWERVRLFDKNIVEILKNACNNAIEPAKVNNVIQKPKSKWRPQPLDTIQLERLGGRYLKLNAKTIMSLAEKLYQNGFISYPRTETTCYSKEFDLASIVNKLAENDNWRNFTLEIQQRGGPNPRNGHKNDQAHPPIHPVKCANITNFATNINEWRVYEFICRHFLASMSRDATGKETKVEVALNGEIFTATGLIIEDMGYLLIYPHETWQDKNLPPYQSGQILSKFIVDMSEGKTEPPSLLSEPDLISLMDKNGIGTDATHAEHIETIKKRWYVIVNIERRFEPTKLGLALIEAYDRMNHEHKMSKPLLRAGLEIDLEKICKGIKTKNEVLQDQLKIYKEIYISTERNINLLARAIQECTGNNQ